MQKERLSWEKFRGEGCCRDRLGEAEIYEWSKYVKKIPHVDILVICHIDKNPYTKRVFAVPYELS